jgi:hypothetical protein
LLAKTFLTIFSGFNLTVRIVLHETRLLDAWAKSGATGTANRAQHIDAMVQQHIETGDELIALRKAKQLPLSESVESETNQALMAEKTFRK